MKNTYFSDEMIELLINCGEWKIVSSMFSPELHPIHHAAHERWMTGHMDRHPHREVLFPLSGRGVYGFQGNIYPCLPGTVFLFDSNEAHDNYYPPHASDATHLWLTFFRGKPGARILNIEGGKLFARKVFVIEDSASAILLDQVWTKMSQDKLSPEPFRRMRIISALSSVLMAAVEQGYGRARRPIQAENQLREIIKSIMLSMSASGGNGLNLEKLARYSGYSKFHFLREFKKYSGKSVHGYIDECRMKKVGEMLKQGHNKSEISESLGFSSLTVFCRWLKNIKDEKKDYR